jgi:pimeloyl-ACP methyl ester carboxylesterase
MLYLPVNGLRIAYVIDGDGPWLLLLHGFSQDQQLWDAQVAALAGSFRLLRVDLRGHGASEAPGAGYGAVEYAADVLGVLDALGIARAHLWGTHTGAGVGLLLAVEHPERVAALILDGAVIPGIAVPVVEEWQARECEIARARGVTAARADWFEQAPFFDGIHADPLRRRAAAQRAMVERFSGAPWLAAEPPLAPPDVAGRLGTIRGPSLIVNGSEDLPDFLAVAARLERELPSATRYLIPGAGAFPAWEEPEAVTPLVSGFLMDVE